MVDEFAKTYNILITLQERYGLSSLEKDEKIIFDCIINSLAQKKSVSIPEIVDRNLTSRASTYRHLNSLISKGFIKIEGHGRKQTVIVASRFKNFEKDFFKQLRKNQSL